MKKISNLFLSLILGFLVLSLVGCTTMSYTVKFVTNGGTELKDVLVEEGRTLTKPEDPTKEGFDFKGWYTDEELNEKFDFDTQIIKDLTLYASWEEKVINTEIYVQGVSTRNEFVVHNQAKQQKDNKRTEFMDLTTAFVVGDDNPFVVKPEMTFIEINTDTREVIDEDIVVETWEYDITIYEVLNATYVKLLEDTEYIDSIDNVNCSVDFSEQAIGKTFKIEVTPRKLTNKQLQKVENYTTSVECSIVEGYNVYNALDFAYFENRNDDEDSRAWKQFKKEHGLDVDFVPEALILQANIFISNEDVPSIFFWSAEEVKGASDADRAVNSLKDYRNIYYRHMNDNDNFAVYGNYFTIDINQIKEVVRENDNITPEGEVISHATFLRIQGSETATATLSELNLVGNAPRVENSIKSGGLIFIKVEGPTFTAYNNISVGWFIAYMPNYSLTQFSMVKCRAYDSYNCFVYNWGCPDVHIVECEMIGAGGPVIIQDHIDPKASDGGRQAKTYIEKSNLQSYVTGSEGWFKGVHADTFVPTILMTDLPFNYFARSFLKTNADKSLQYFNIICVNKTNNQESFEPSEIEGVLKIDDLPAFDFGNTNPYVKALIEATRNTESAVFQTTAGGSAYITTQGLFDVAQNQIIDPSNPIYQGDYLCLYYMGNMIVFEFNTFNPLTGEYEIYNPNN